MAEQQWTAVDDYITKALIPSDEALEHALKASAAGGLPAISVSVCQGKLLYLMARMQQAQRVLEIGTLGGYSTIWMAKALREMKGQRRLITLEVNPKHAEVANANFAHAGLSDLIELRLGKGLDTLPKLEAEGVGPFDLVFIDADKPTTPEYFQWAVKLSRPGTVIIVDNVIRHGAVADAASSDANVQGIRRFNELMAADRRVSATAIQTVGSKGYDGFAIAMVGE